MHKEIRIVNIGGKYSLRWVYFDDDGDMVRVLRDDVELSFKDICLFKDTLRHVTTASEKPVVVVNSGNKSLLLGEV